jgi:hypothetical protein
MIEGKSEVYHEKYAAWAYFCQFTATTFEIPLETSEVSDPGRGSAGSLATRREPIIEDISRNRGSQGIL